MHDGNARNCLCTLSFAVSEFFWCRNCPLDVFSPLSFSHCMCNSIWRKTFKWNFILDSVCSTGVAIALTISLLGTQINYILVRCFLGKKVETIRTTAGVAHYKPLKFSLHTLCASRVAHPVNMGMGCVDLLCILICCQISGYRPWLWLFSIQWLQNTTSRKLDQREFASPPGKLQDTGNSGRGLVNVFTQYVSTIGFAYRCSTLLEDPHIFLECKILELKKHKERHNFEIFVLFCLFGFFHNKEKQTNKREKLMSFVFLWTLLMFRKDKSVSPLKFWHRWTLPGELACGAHLNMWYLRLLSVTECSVLFAANVHTLLAAFQRNTET